ncbi:hypothetical protein Q2T41_06985 [Maribacter confluentis]|uniref:Uncharacterized protein n=1 Tax=Maribacter confluentis TaxID=1656093 RepID=A0ABT8RND2_9FLAO|nr:hypothetical protein [Maribacter confluentis]MDO1512394.1 hypothetical protein [Maribacter confluentis]
MDTKTLENDVFRNSENLELIINSDQTFRITNLPIAGWQFGVFQKKRKFY